MQSSKNLFLRPNQPLRGTVTIPGDKSISHRALMFGAISTGQTVVRGLLESEDTTATATALRLMGAKIDHSGDQWQITGVGNGGLRPPENILDMGNSGTSTRLLMGLLASYPFTCFFTGDGSLRKRPMARVTEPLKQIGASFLETFPGKLPMAMTGTDTPIPIVYELPVASAQVKSAVLLAGLNTPGRTTVIEPIPTRDHTERMLEGFGARLIREGTAIHLEGQPVLRGAAVDVPADPSSAAFILVAASLVAGSTVTLPGVCMNPTRTGLLTTLQEMGAQLTMTNTRTTAGEAVADITVAHSPLRAVDVPASRAPSMIDEYPILAVAAACATGTSILRGLGELRVKESDRLQTMADGLRACGVAVEITADDDLIIHGTGTPPAGGTTIATALDHRIAMSFLILGLVSSQPVVVDDAAPIQTSFPTFLSMMHTLGAEAGWR